ncbi:MAG: sel1 repeat family protein [Brevundimonas sp.]|nr:MAG: sel1 repeat family protein [Brevundimonas sp.]
MNMRHHLLAGVAAALLLCGSPASAQDVPDAASPLDSAYDLISTDPVAAYAALQLLSDAGDAEAKNAVAVMLESGLEGTPADPERALVLLREAAEAGSDAARLNLGSRLLLNDQSDDDAEAVAALVQITNGDLVKRVGWPLGRAYLFGQGVERDLARGSRLMMDAVEVDPENIDAQFLLARAYQNGWGIPRDDTAAYRHFRVAADGGDERAQWQVGMILLNGDGVAANPGLARRYVTASAESGYMEGMISMAVMYAVGEGGPVDGVKARYWYRRAAEAGSAHALRGLGGMLMVGEGGPQDRVTGAAYLDLAAKAGDSPAARMQGVFAAEIRALNRAEVEAAKSRWLGEHGQVR